MVEQAVTRIRSMTLAEAGADADFMTALEAFVSTVALEPDGEETKRLRALTRQLPINVWAVDPDGIFTQVMGNSMSRLGLEADDLIGLHVGVFGDLASGEIHRALSGESAIFTVEGHTDGAEWHYKVFVVPLPDGMGAAAISIDATPQAEAAREAIHAAQSDRRFAQLAEHAPVGIFIVGDGSEIVFANPQLCELLQVDRSQIEGHAWLDFVHPDDLAIATDFDETRVFDAVPPVLEFRITRPDGSIRWVRCRVTLRVGQHEDIIAVGTAADVTESVMAAQALHESNDRTRAILESAADGIVTADENMRVIEFNAAAEGIFGYDSAEAIGLPIGSLIAAEDRDLVNRYFSDFSGAGRTSARGPREVQVRRRDGSVVSVELTVTAVATGSGRLFIGMVHDLSERKAFLRQLEHQSTHDPLTGLPNRVLLMAQLQSALARARRLARPVAALFLGLDRMKLVTDTLGHAAGDRIIVEAGQRLTAVARDAGAVVTRFGGDQFVLVCEEIDDVGESVDLALAAVDALEVPFVVGDEEAFLSADVGIAFAPLGVGSADTLVSNADVAYYQAKGRADQRYEVFDAEMRAWVESRRKLEIALRYGIDRDEFDLHYQPIVELDGGRVRGVEALARWNHPVLGLLPPDQFIPLAEESGLIVPLGESLLHGACERLAAWQKVRPEVFVSVNLSGHQLALPDLVDTITRAVRRAGAVPAGLHLEITETMLLRDVDAAERSLRALKEVGVKLCLDDFGTGYSSLSYLGRFPIDTLKVDRAFVSGLGQGGREASIVAMIVGMAGALDIDVVAEGVETKDQVLELRHIGCGLGQGYLFARPKPWADAETHFDGVAVEG